MKKFSAIIVAVLLVAMLAIPVMASPIFNYANGKITGTYEGSGGNVEIWVNDEPKGGKTLSMDAVEGQTYTIEVYENGVLVTTETVTATTPAPTVEPTPQPTVQPTPEPTGQPTPEPTNVPEPTRVPDKKTEVDSNGKDKVPTTGEYDFLLPFACVAMAGVAGMVIFRKKHA